jgi:hypothetical protein
MKFDINSTNDQNSTKFTPKVESNELVLMSKNFISKFQTEGFESVVQPDGGK